MNQQKIDTSIYKSAKTVGCEFSKYIQLLENRQKKIRKYKKEDIKPLPTVLEKTEETYMRENTDKEEKIIEEQIQRNCEEIQKLINQKPKSSISVLRTGIDKCQIREKRTRKVLYEEKTEESFIKLKEMLSIVSKKDVPLKTVKEIQPLEVPSDEESKEILRSLGYDI